MSFEQRKNKATLLEDKIKEYFKNMKIEYALSGYENIISSDNFKDVIREKKDKTSERIRFFPDFTVVNKTSWLIEAKNSICIEKQAYNNYMDLNRIGYNVGIIFYKDGKLLFVDISELRLKPAYCKNVPILENVWLAPRELSKVDYLKWKTEHQKASGTTFGYIDFDNSKMIELNQKDVIAV